jgi:hypothetical protein
MKVDPTDYVKDYLALIDARIIDKHYMTISLDCEIVPWAEVRADDGYRGLIPTSWCKQHLRMSAYDKGLVFRRGALAGALNRIIRETVS